MSGDQEGLREARADPLSGHGQGERGVRGSGPVYRGRDVRVSQHLRSGHLQPRGGQTHARPLQVSSTGSTGRTGSTGSRVHITKYMSSQHLRSGHLQPRGGQTHARPLQVSSTGRTGRTDRTGSRCISPNTCHSICYRYKYYYHHKNSHR